MSFIILTASPIELAWNPRLFIPLIKSSTVISRPANLLKSSSSTFWEPSGISFEGTRTASVTEEGNALGSEFVVMLNAGLRRLVGRIWSSEEKSLAALKLKLSELVDNGYPFLF
jgi:hypothetical protein